MLDDFIKVITSHGRVIGAKEIRVSPGKVGIERLQADIFTGLHVNFSMDDQLHGVVKMTVTRETKLKEIYQVKFMFTQEV